MQSLTTKATQDAAAVKVLTIITLVYLPTTAVLVWAFVYPVSSFRLG